MSIAMIIVTLTATGEETEPPASHRSPRPGPSIILGHPASGGTLTVTGPLLVFRFGGVDADDPIDPTSFHATVDGGDRTALFHATSAMAWADTKQALGARPRVVTGRICTASGVCAEATAMVRAQPR